MDDSFVIKFKGQLIISKCLKNIFEATVKAVNDLHYPLKQKCPIETMGIWHHPLPATVGRTQQFSRAPAPKSNMFVCQNMDSNSTPKCPSTGGQVSKLCPVKHNGGWYNIQQHGRNTHKGKVHRKARKAGGSWDARHVLLLELGAGYSHVLSS